MANLVERAPAKINLTLAVRGRRADGYHLLDSLVVFAREADRLTFKPSEALSLRVRGATARQAGPPDDNLVLKAARGLAAAIPGLRLGRFTLDKHLPVAAGLGGGSSDAAAALRLLARANRLKLSDPRLRKVAQTVGADVPICLDPKLRWMRGIGEILSGPLALPKLAAVLVNPGVTVPTKDVFVRLGLKPGSNIKSPVRPKNLPRSRGGLIEALAGQGNDLEPAAIEIQPVIARVLEELRAAPGCQLARMSGSGATCFSLFASSNAAASAARRIKAAHPRWWVRATILG
jgi:4-diphosphocytidyl-2-C-methyl-D-erythritol kinase